MERQFNPFLIIIPPEYVSALLKLHEKLEDKNIEWALSGKLGEALKGVRVEPDCIEIVTSKDGAEQINDLVKEFNPEQIAYRVQQLSRTALINGVENPIYIRSHYFEFNVDGIKAEVHGDLQFKVNDWAWGDKFDFLPDTVYVVNKKTSVVPLNVRYDLYQSLGWIDRAEKISSVIANHQRLLHRNIR
jgi:hypothetical protein